VTGLECIKPLWCAAAPASALECTVQLRAHGDEHRAVVTPTTEGFSVALLDVASGIAPGQACVIYDGTRVVGSGTIARTSR
jgi:tRNA-specific 2-thiouridylase